jgi:hypothetical protein
VKGDGWEKSVSAFGLGNAKEGSLREEETKSGPGLLLACLALLACFSPAFHAFQSVR